MTQKRTLRQVGIALMLLVAFLLQGTWALAGTTGTLSGNVYDDKGAGVSAVTITATAPSGTATTTTDATGHFVFLSLAPDTYLVKADKAGYSSSSQSGITVFADNTQNVTFHITTLKEIGRVTSRSANDLVKSGTTSDVYSVNAATAEKVAAIGGGTNLNSAYSALASQPGVTLGYGGIGWGQTVFIHGASYSQVGYEFDGVPVNRAFDNYNANSLSNLGQQELQVVTGGAPAGSSSQTVGGFINQVIRTGTYPGFGTLQLGIGGPSFYHDLKGEAGGATPNRLFSYYVGLQGTNQAPRFWDNFEGGSGLPGFTPLATQWETNTALPAGMFPYCAAGTGSEVPGQAATFGANDPGCVGGPFPFNLGATGTYSDREAVANFHIGVPHRYDSGRDDIQLLYDGSYQNQTSKDSINDYGGQNYICNVLFGGAYGNPCIKYADAVIFGSGVQFGQLINPAAPPPTQPYYFPSSNQQRPLNSLMPTNLRSGQNNDAEIFKLQYQHNIGSTQYVRLYGYTFYSDWLLNSPMGGELIYKLGNYIAAGTPDYELITHTRGGEFQYANQINAKNLLTFTANYTTAGVSRFNNGTFRNSGSGSSIATNLAVLSGPNAGTCYSYTTGAQVACFNGSGINSAAGGSFVNPSRGQNQCGGPAPTPPAAACAAGAQWAVTFTGPRGTLNTVTPKFTSLSLTDEYRPNDRLLINAGLRTDRYEYDLRSTAGADYNFWFKAAQNSFCYDPAAANGAVFQPAPAVGAIPGGTPLFTGLTCPASPVNGCTTLHPNGQAQVVTGCTNPANNGTYTAKLYSSFTNPSYSVSKVEPRISGTYTFNPDSVLRLSFGQYVNPFNTATVEYLDANAQRAAYFDYASFWGVGFNTPEHDVQPSTSTNIDASFEHRVHGSDLSYKISPFYRYVQNQTQDSFIGPGFVSAIPTNNETAYGLEFQINKGDPRRDGWSGQLSYTYTKATSKFNTLGNGQNFIDTINAQVLAYNSLTASGSGQALTYSSGQTVNAGVAAPCYVGGAPSGTGPTGVFANPAFCSSTGSGTATSCVTVTPAGIVGGAIVNPYYCAPRQPFYDPHGSYPLYQSFPNVFENAPGADINGTIVWPNVFAGWVNYKHDKLSITPNFQLIEGAQVGSSGGGQYGNPLSILGLDPRTCGANQGQSGIASAANPGWANYLSCGGSPNALGQLFIPNPTTGRFDNFGQYQNPWLLNINAQIRYDFSPRVTGQLVLANLYNTCFGGSSTSWTSANPPNHQGICAYTSNSGYVGAQPGAGFFLGNSPADPANPRPYTNNVLQPYQPIGGFLPFNAYLTFQIKL